MSIKSLIDQFYGQLREVMFANKLTSSDLAGLRGVHPTYIYNTIRSTKNLSLKTAQQLAEAAGYALKLTFVPTAAGRAPITGTMEADGKTFSRRRTKEQIAAEAKAKEADALDAELEALGAVA